MKLTLAEPKYLREPILIISELVSEVRIKLDHDKLELVAMDPANVAMIVFRLLSSAFVEYELKDPVEMALNLDHLKQILRRAKPSDTLTLQLDEAKNRLNINLRGENNRDFHLSLINLEDKEQKIPDLKFTTRIETLSSLFDEAVEDMDVVSDSVALVADSNKFIIQAEGNLSQAKVEALQSDDTLIKTGSGVIKSRYSIEYLKKVIKGSKLSSNVVLQFDKDYPLKIDYIVKDKLSLTTSLGPIVPNE